MHKCTSTTITMHICTVTIALAFNILVFFFLSHCLWLLSLSPHSLFFSFDQIIIPAKPLNLLQPLISHHHRQSPLPLISRQSPWSLSDHLTLPLFLVVWLVGFGLGGWWFGSFVSHSLISGLFGWGVNLAGLNGLAFLDDGSWVGDDGGWVWSDCW